MPRCKEAFADSRYLDREGFRDHIRLSIHLLHTRNSGLQHSACLYTGQLTEKRDWRELTVSEGESVTLTLGSMAAGRHSAGAAAKSSRLIHKLTAEREREHGIDEGS